jgi:hypothetical protein
MNAIIEPNDNFSFVNLTMTSPVVVAGGNHFIKYLLNDRPLYIQPPNCKLKQGIIKAGKRSYCDLMFTNENENFIRWMENLEAHSRKLIFNNRAKWFETELEEHDIENSFASPLKIFKSGKFYIARVNVPSALGKTTLKIYDENENLVDGDTLKENENVATILEIQGIRCSPRMFQIDLEMKQLLVLKPVDLFEKCILLKPTKPLEEPKYAPEPTPTPAPVVQQPEASLIEGTLTEDTLTEGTLTEDTLTEGTLTEDIPLPEAQPEPEPEKEVQTKSSDDLEEIELEIDSIDSDEKLFLKKRNDVYYKMYKEALKKARVAKELALTSYLEAKHIKNTYMLTDLSDDSDLDEDLDMDD